MAVARSTALDGEFDRRAPRSGGWVGYVIAAYGLVIVTLALYGLRVQAQRRAQLRRPPGPSDPRKG
jgi:hypothetical protein